MKISLAGRVAVVTGAGRGLGKAYAEMLAARGASVVVNDLGTDGLGDGTDASVADQVAGAIRGQGGKAVANTDDVADVQGSAAIVQMALEAFGRIDIVINNAGIRGTNRFAESDLDHFLRCWKVHVGGAINVTKAAWPHLIGQGYGRVVLAGSAGGLFGNEESAYASAKGAMHGLMRSLALQGREHGVLVNEICPGGFSRMMQAGIEDPVLLEKMKALMPAEAVSPAIVWLASEQCTVSGEAFSVWAGRVARIGIGSGRGLVTAGLTPEGIVEGYDKVSSLDGFYEAKSAVDDVSFWLPKL